MRLIEKGMVGARVERSRSNGHGWSGKRVVALEYTRLGWERRSGSRGRAVAVERTRQKHWIGAVVDGVRSIRGGLSADRGGLSVDAAKGIQGRSEETTTATYGNSRRGSYLI